MTQLTTPEEYAGKTCELLNNAHTITIYQTFQLLRKHVKDERTILHSARVAYRVVKRNKGKGINLLLRLATVGLLHDLLEDADDPLAAATEMSAEYVDLVESDAILRLTRRVDDSDETYFARLEDLSGDNLRAWEAAVLVKIEDTWDNMKDAWTAFGPRRHVKFAMKAVQYVLPLADQFTPDLAREMRNDVARMLSRVPVK
jgi:hypothetical protein